MMENAIASAIGQSVIQFMAQHEIPIIAITNTSFSKYNFVSFMKLPIKLCLSAYDFNTIGIGYILFCIKLLLSPLTILVAEYFTGFEFYFDALGLSVSLMT